MGLFEDRKTEKEKIQEFVESYQLQELDKEDIEALFKVRMGAYSRAVVVQNYIIIKQLTRLNKNLEDLKNK